MSMSISGETASWEDSELQLLLKDPSLLQSFQTLKYVNGERSRVFPTYPVVNDADFTADR